MKITITSRENNPLLRRKEIAFEVNHEKTGGTPARFDVRKELAAVLKMDIDRVYVKKMVTKTGTRTAFGLANAYDSTEQAKIVEAKHLLARNTPPKKSEKEEEAPDKMKEKEEGAKKPLEKEEETEKQEEAETENKKENVEAVNAEDDKKEG